MPSDPQNQDQDELVSEDELARFLGRSVDYVRVAHRKGMPRSVGRFYRLAEAIDWLTKNPYPRKKTPVKQPS